MSKKEFEDRRDEIEFMKWQYDYFLEKFNKNQSYEFSKDEKFVDKYYKERKALNLPVQPFEFPIFEEQNDGKTISFNHKNRSKFKKEIEEKERILREDELRESQLDFVKAQKEFQKNQINLTTLIIEITLIFGVVTIISKINNSIIFQLGVIVFILYSVLFFANKKLSLKEFFKKYWYLQFIIIILFAFPISQDILESKQPEQINITNLDQITQNQLEIIKLLNNTQEINLSVTLPEELLEINERLERLEKELKVTK